MSGDVMSLHRTATPHNPKNNPVMFTYSNIRYKGKELQGYVVIPKVTLDDKV
jgi:hypothetical protein